MNSKEFFQRAHALLRISPPGWHREMCWLLIKSWERQNHDWETWRHLHAPSSQQVASADRPLKGGLRIFSVVQQADSEVSDDGSADHARILGILERWLTR